MLYIYLPFLPFFFLFLRHLGECCENWSLGNVPRLPGQLLLWNDFAAFRHRVWFFVLLSKLLVGVQRGRESIFFFFYFVFEVSMSTNVPMSMLVKVVIIWGGWWGNRELDVSKLVPLNTSIIFIFNWLTTFQLRGNPAQQWDLEIFGEWPCWIHVQVACKLDLMINMGLSGHRSLFQP